MDGGIFWVVGGGRKFFIAGWGGCRYILGEWGYIVGK